MVTSKESISLGSPPRLAQLKASEAQTTEEEEEGRVFFHVIDLIYHSYL